MRYPKFLKQGGRIGFVSPSFGCNIEPYKSGLNSAIEELGRRGYCTDIGYNCYKGDGIGISSTPESCAGEFVDYYTNHHINSLISCGGGELMCQILDYIDFERLIGSEPKWFIGYSDNTNMTFLLTTLCDTASIYGPCASAFGMKPWHKAIEDAMGILTGKITQVTNYEKWEKESLKNAENPYEPYNATEEFKYIVFPLDGIEMEGRLLGGCLNCLADLVGTKYDRTAQFVEKYKEDGIIWFIESCELNPMGIRRAMWQLHSSGWFKYAKGFIIGRPYGAVENELGLDVHEAVLGILRQYNVPVIMDADVGHMPPMMPLVTGSMANVKAANNKIIIDMKYI